MAALDSRTLLFKLVKKKLKEERQIDSDCTVFSIHDSNATDTKTEWTSMKMQFLSKNVDVSLCQWFRIGLFYIGMRMLPMFGLFLLGTYTLIHIHIFWLSTYATVVSYSEQAIAQTTTTTTLTSTNPKDQNAVWTKQKKKIGSSQRNNKNNSIELKFIHLSAFVYLDGKTQWVVKSSQDSRFTFIYILCIVDSKALRKGTIKWGMVSILFNSWMEREE